MICTLALATLLGACGRDDPAAAGPDRAPATAPAVPSPHDGVLRARIEATPVADPRSTADSSTAGPVADDIVLVGDSVLVLVADELAGLLDATLHVDAADCRTLARPVTGPCGGVPAGVTVDSGLDALERSLAGRAEPPDAAVLVLANNASVDAGQLDAAMAASSGIDRVWWVNTRIDGFGRQDSNNRLLDELAARDPRARVVDWFSASEGEGLLADNVHPNDVGQRRLARLIAGHLRDGGRP